MTNERTIIETPDKDEMRAEYSGLLLEAEKVKVTDLATHEIAKAMLYGLAMRKRKIHERLDPIAESAYKTHKGVTSLRAELLQPIEAAEARIGLEVNAYDEKERARAAAAAKAKEDPARKAEEERRLADAEAAEMEGKREEAEAILEAPLETESIAPEPILAKVDGESSRTNYGAECFDVLALAKYVVAHPEDKALLSAHGPNLNARARSQREGFKLPGCRLKKTVSRSFRDVSGMKE